jgi:hypothetical protein
VQPHLSLIEAGRGTRVLEDFIRPDLARLLDEARGELLLERLRHEAGELVGEELVDWTRHPGKAVRALARTVSGRGVAVLAADAKPADAEEEVKELKPALGANLVRLVAHRAADGDLRLARPRA